MALEQGDNIEARSFVPSGLAEHAGLSRSAQDLFQPIDRAIANRQDLPWALDFGTGADLYRLPAYTGERRSLSALMTDDVEQKLDAPKIQPPSDNLARPSVIRTKQDEAIWDEMQKPHKLGKHESATHIGLSPEVIAEMQKKGQASKLEFFDSKAEEALEALQKPATEKTLIASNITPNVPNLEQKQQYQDIQSDSEAPKLAQNLEYDGGLPTLLPDPEIMRILGETATEATVSAYKYGFEHPYRGRELSHVAAIPQETFSQAFGAFPELQLIGKLSEQNATQLMKAIIANELDHYDWRDRLADSVAGAAHGYGKTGEVTIGYSQISVKGVQDLAKDFQKEVDKGDRSSNPLAKYLKMSNEKILESLSNPQELPLLVAANLAHNVGMYNRNHYPINEQTLGYGFNPDLPPQKPKEGHELLPPKERLDKSPHAHNISVWLQKIHDAENGK